MTEVLQRAASLPCGGEASQEPPLSPLQAAFLRMEIISAEFARRRQLGLRTPTLADLDRIPSPSFPPFCSDEFDRLQSEWEAKYGHTRTAVKEDGKGEP